MLNITHQRNAGILRGLYQPTLSVVISSAQSAFPSQLLSLVLFTSPLHGHGQPTYDPDLKVPFASRDSILHSTSATCHFQDSILNHFIPGNCTTSKITCTSNIFSKHFFSELYFFQLYWEASKVHVSFWDTGLTQKCALATWALTLAGRDVASLTQKLVPD